MLRIKGRSAFTVLSTLLLLLSSFFHDARVHAYDAAPQPRRLSAYAKLNNKFYLQGGLFSSSTYTGQLMSLDLSVNWNTTDGAWTTTGYTDGLQTSRHAMAAVPSAFSAGLGTNINGHLLLVGSSVDLNSSFLWNGYNLDTNVWSPVTPTPLPTLKNVFNFTNLQRHAIVTDPDTGLVYVIGGFQTNATKVYTYNRLIVMDPSTKTLIKSDLATAATGLASMAAAWSTVRKTVMVFGGTQAPPSPGIGGLNNMTEYNPSTDQWTPLITTGDVPTRRLEHCVAASDDGSKIILFGGSLDGETYFNTLYILDVSTLIWTMGKSAPLPRVRMMCTYNQRQFITWGGSTDNDVSTISDSSIGVYDVDYNEWSAIYSSVPPTTAPSDTSAPKSDGRKMSGVAIGGAAIGGAAALALVIAGYLFYRKRKMKEESKKRALKDDVRLATAIAESHNDDHKDDGRYRQIGSATGEASRRISALASPVKTVLPNGQTMPMPRHTYNDSYVAGSNIRSITGSVDSSHTGEEGGCSQQQKPSFRISTVQAVLAPYRLTPQQSPLHQHQQQSQTVNQPHAVIENQGYSDMMSYQQQDQSHTFGPVMVPEQVTNPQARSLSNFSDNRLVKDQLQDQEAKHAHKQGPQQFTDFKNHYGSPSPSMSSSRPGHSSQQQQNNRMGVPGQEYVRPPPSQSR